VSHSVYPWSAVVGQDALKRALLLCAIDQGIGGVLVQGPRGVAKTTLARSLGELLPGRFVELPLGATDERVTGTLDLQSALRDGRVEFSPGLLARAHEGVLYVDEINLLPDSLVDLLLDAAATGRNVVERDGVSHAHAARLVLVGTMNPEEGALRPQLIDRFGLSVSADAEIRPRDRAEIVARRLAFDGDPIGFCARFAAQQAALVERCQRARELVAKIELAGPGLERVSERCYAAGVEGVRADIAMLRAARAHAAWHGRAEITAQDVEAVAELALAHRRRAGHNEPPPSGSGAPPAAGGGAAGAGRVGGDWGSSAGAPRADSDAAGDDARAGAERGRASHGESGDTADGESGDARRAEQAAADSCGHSRPGTDPQADLGALPARAVRALAPPRSAVRLFAAQAARADARRRGTPQLLARRGTRAREQREHGAIDWFATLARARRPARDQLRYRARRAPTDQLWILAVDCSSSMLRGGALAAAKSVAHALEADAVRVGAHVALISFRGPSARLEVTSSAGRFALVRAISELAAGGGTPLRTALLAAHELCRQRRFRSDTVAKTVVLLTDGRTRDRLADLVSFGANPGLLVIDCERSQLRLARAAGLAAALGGRCMHVNSLL
jgi:Mg-chelatase subunit ChlI/Mg-chelatase subunit ChlD